MAAAILARANAIRKPSRLITERTKSGLLFQKHTSQCKALTNASTMGQDTLCKLPTNAVLAVPVVFFCLQFRPPAYYSTRSLHWFLRFLHGYPHDSTESSSIFLQLPFFASVVLAFLGRHSLIVAFILARCVLTLARRYLRSDGACNSSMSCSSSSIYIAFQTFHPSAMFQLLAEVELKIGNLGTAPAEISFEPRNAGMRTPNAQRLRQRVADETPQKRSPKAPLGLGRRFEA